MTIKEFTDDESASTKAKDFNANLQDVALQSLCKNLLKNQLFRGLYKERAYVEQLQQYRDKICLHTSEKEIKNKLLNVVGKLQKFYDQQECHITWIGITDDVANTYIWTELKDLAFGEYWFTIKGIKFNCNEIIVRVKAIRSIEPEVISAGRSKMYHDTYTTEYDSENSAQSTTYNLTSSVEWNDFLKLPPMWLHSIKDNIYYFLSHDLNMANIKIFFKYLILLLISLVSTLFVFIKFLGYFVIRFMGELSNLSTALTPIVLKIIDVCLKIIGGLFILLAMIYKDCFGRNHSRQPRNVFTYQALPSSRPVPKNWRY